MQQIWDWAKDNLGIVLTTTTVVGAIAGFIGKSLVAWLLDQLKESRQTKSDQKRAATEFAHIVNQYRDYWIAKHFEDENAEPVRDHWVQWSGDSFSPLIAPEHRPLHARLSPALKAAAFALHDKVAKAKSFIASVSEYRDSDLDFEGPITVSEIAIATDDLYRAVMKEADLPPAPQGYAFESIRRRLATSEKEKRDDEEANKAAWMSVTKAVEEKTQP